MIERGRKLPDEPQRKSSLLNTIMWVVIGLGLIFTIAWTVWAGRQPRLHSVWPPVTPF